MKPILSGARGSEQGAGHLSGARVLDRPEQEASLRLEEPSKEPQAPDTPRQMPTPVGQERSKPELTTSLEIWDPEMKLA